MLSFPYSVDEGNPQFPPKKPGKGLTEYVLRAGKSVLCDEALYEGLRQRGEIELVGVHSPIWLGVPLIVEGKVIGVMVVQDYKNARAYGEREQRILEFVSSQVAMAIHRKQVEEALRESEERYRQLMETLPDGVIVHSQGRIVFANPASARIGGTASPAELIGKPVIEFVHPDDRKLALKRIQKSFREGNPASATEDITERKQAEEALRNREGLLQRIFDILPVGLWFADKDGKLLRGNPAGVKIWGAEPKVSLSEYGVFKARRLPSGEEVAPDDWALAHTIRDKVTIVDELLEIDAFDGKKKTILNYTAPVLDAQGDVQGAIVVNQDITERKHDEFGQSMTALKMDLTWLAKRLPEGDEKVKRIDGMTTLVDESIALMRRIATELRPGLLDDLGLNAAVEWQSQEFSRRSGIPCKLNLPEHDLGLDPALNTTLFRIFQETLTNIARHAQATHVNASLKQKDHTLVLTIRDNGRGITESELKTRVHSDCWACASAPANGGARPPSAARPERAPP